MCFHKWKIQNISDGFFILSPGSCPRGGTWGYLGAKIQIQSCCLSVMLSPPKPLDEIQLNLVCELLTWMGRATSIFFAPPPWALGRGQMVKYHLILITKSISKIFIPNFMCVLTNERYKTYQSGFSLCSLGHALWVGLWDAWGAQVVKKIIKHGLVVYQIDEDEEQNRMQVKLLSYGQTGDLGVRSKVKYL